MREFDVIARLRRFCDDPAARGLRDDVALLDGLVITHDSIAEGVHFRRSDPAASVGWKLVTVNLSDLAAKGAVPAGALLSLALSGDDEWDSGFLTGVEHACESYALPLIGGDTFVLPAGAPRVLGLTAIGRAGEQVPTRAGASAGDGLWLVGTLGDSAAGLAQLQEDPGAAGPLVDVYRRPIPQLGAGQILAPHASAMMDVSDGLLLDAWRIAEASECAVAIALDRITLSEAFVAERGGDRQARLFAATGGDDYALLVALPPTCDPETLCLPEGTTISRIGSIAPGEPRLSLTWHGKPVQLPERLGFEHKSNRDHHDAASPVGNRA